MELQLHTVMTFTLLSFTAVYFIGGLVFETLDSIRYERHKSKVSEAIRDALNGPKESDNE